jgi:hypothetical protein
VLIDQDAFGKGFSEGRRVIPFTAREGQYWGPPTNGAQAVSELSASRVRYVVVGWPAFWWLDHYPELRAHLDAHFDRVLDNERLKVFAAHTPASPAAPPGPCAASPPSPPTSRGQG